MYNCKQYTKLKRATQTSRGYSEFFELSKREQSDHCKTRQARDPKVKGYFLVLDQIMSGVHLMINIAKFPLDKLLYEIRLIATVNPPNKPTVCGGYEGRSEESH